jgi:exodeoxyribonuclease VII small subunit
MPLSPNPEPGLGSRKPRKASTTESLTFEVAYRELQQVVEQLEGGQLDLEQTVTLFERGSQLARTCERIVDEAQLRITRVAAESASPLSEQPVEP